MEQPPVPYAQPIGSPPPGGYSAAGPNAFTMPLELQMKFNFGAFIWGFWWTLWNAPVKQRWIAVGCAVLSVFTGGLLGLAYQIYLGIYANRITLAYRRYDGVEQFRAVQRAWTKWAIILLIVSVGLGILGAILSIILAIALPHTTPTTT
jgi:hypothetical protein